MTDEQVRRWVSDTGMSPQDLVRLLRKNGYNNIAKQINKQLPAKERV